MNEIIESKGSERPVADGLVSIILPSLNAREFLTQRIDSILSQSYGNWEAIVLDSFSIDGTWEYLCEIAETDSRFRLYQIPREGLYRALNRGIELANGEFLHIATCDDTMEAGFLLETVRSLQETPTAGISATDARFIDAAGNDYMAMGNGEAYVRTLEVGLRPSTRNLRVAPHDSYLHLSTHSVYFSLTQVVVRRESMLPSDLFRTDTGSVADFGWVLNLTSHMDTVHIPEKLATWRIHGAQLSLAPDPRRNQIIADYCVEFLGKSGLSDYKRFLLSLPAMKLRSYESEAHRLTVGTGLKAGLLLVVAVAANVSSVARALRMAKFGKADLKTSWVSFLIYLFSLAR